MQREFFCSLDRLATCQILEGDEAACIRMSNSRKILVSVAFFFGMLLLTIKAVPAAEWTDTRVYGPFICRADFSLEGKHRCLNELGELQTDLVKTLQIPKAKEAIQVYLFHDEDTYRRYLKRIYPTLPFRRAFFIQEHGVERVFAFDSPQFEDDLRHECTHSLLHAALPSVPLWLDEGLASYFEVLPKNRLNKAPYFSDVLWNVRFGSVPDLGNLEKMSDVAAMKKIEYHDSWAWVHFMCQGPTAAHEELVGYLRDLGDQKSPILLSERLARRIPSLSAEFKASFKQAASTPSASK
jgi:hypothetical protein